MRGNVVACGKGIEFLSFSPGVLDLTLRSASKSGSLCNMEVLRAPFISL